MTENEIDLATLSSCLKKGDEKMKMINSALRGVGIALMVLMLSASWAAAQGHSMKLPYALMPKSGRIADYDFEGSATNRVPSAGKIISRDLQIVAGALYSPGDYGNCCRIDIPEINYDNLTVALSFKPEGANKGSWIPVFSFGEPWGSSIRWFNASIRRDHTLEFGFNAYGYTIKTGVEVKMGEWNYLVCSVDAVNKKVIASVNGNVCEWELPVDFAWQFSDMRSREECRCIGFSNRNSGLVYKGSIDDFLVYDYALGKDEVSAIAAGKCSARREVPRSGETACQANERREMPASPDGKWLFVPSTERSLYWNGEIRDGNWTLDVHREGANLVVQPHYSRGSGVLDLKKPVVDETGAKLTVVGVGYSRGFGSGMYHPSVTGVVLPDTLTKIYPNAFSFCNFSSVAIPESVSEIGSQAFSHCWNLKDIVIPSSVKEIGDRAFQECKSLVSVDIRGADVKVAKLAFRGDTPVGAKMPDLSQPIGPIHVRFEPVTAAAASAQDLLSRSRAKRWSRLQQEVSQSVDSEKARKARAAQRSQFSAGSLSTEFERERDTLFMDIVREAEICQTNLAEYATYPYWPDAMGVISNFCAQEGCVIVDAGHHFGAWRQGCGKKACVATSDLKRRRLFIPNVRTEYVNGVCLISRGDDGFCLVSRGGAYTNAACSGVGTICCYDSDGRFEGLYDSVDKLPGMQQCFDDELKLNYGEQDRWMKAHGFAEEGSGREAENRLDAARTNAIARLEALRTILAKFPQWKAGSKWYEVCDVGAELRGPSASGSYRPRLGFGGLRSSAAGINTNDAVFVKMNERFENLGHSQDRLIEEVVRVLTGLEFGSSTDTNGVLDLKSNLGSYENCTFGCVTGEGTVNSVTLIAEFDPSCEQKTIHEKLDQGLSMLLSAIGMDRDSLSYNVPSNEARPLLGRLRRPGGNEDWKGVQSFSQRFTISRSKQQSGEYVVTISDQKAREPECQARAAPEKTQREAERAEQRRQLQAINEELKKVREQKAAAAKSERITSCITNKPTSGKGVVAEKLGQCDFLLNKDFKKNAKFYLCLFSASWCPPCRREMPRIAKTYAETLKDDPDIELIHFSRDQNDEKALVWAKEHDVKFPVVKPKGGNPLDLHSRGIPHLFIVKADGTLVDEGHPMRIFNEEKFREIKNGRMGPGGANAISKGNELTAEVDGYTWTYTIKDGTAVIGAITDGRCSMSERCCAISPNPTGHITIPSTLNGVKVVSIGENALCGCKGIRSVTIPEDVTSIGRSAFNRCEGLTDVKIPNSVTTIGEYSFDWCGSMTNVTLGEGVTTIGSCAFRGCYGLTGIRIPKNVKNVEGSAFIFSRKMKEFVVDEGNENFTTVNGMILSKDRRKLHVGVNGDVSIPDGVTSVLSMAFCRRSGLTSVKLPNSVTNIDGFSFAGCCALKTVTIPVGVTSIGLSAFSDCKELVSVTMRGEKPNVEKGIFYRCKKLKVIHVPASAKSWAGMREWQGIPLAFDAEAKE